METAEVRSIDQIKADLKLELEADYTKRLESELDKIKTENQAAFTKVVEEWKAAQKPPTPEEIKTLLLQEYYEFPVKLLTRGGTKDFVIRELPQAVEKKFYKSLKAKILPRVKELVSLAVEEDDTTQTEKKLASIIEMLDPTFDILAETVAMILNPFNEDIDVTAQWVQDNISSFRQYNIILAQERANRLRDFFSHVSQDSLGSLMTGVGSQS